MKAAVVYYSMGGNVRYAAQQIARRLDADLLEIEPEKAYPDKGAAKFFWGGKSAVMAEKPALKPYDFHPAGYDRIILGFPVWAGTFAPPLRSFILENKADIASKHFAAFACQSGSGGEKALRKLKELIGVDAFDAELILIDPKDKPEEENAERIEAFCASCA